MDIQEYKESLNAFAEKRDIMDKEILRTKEKRYTYKEFLEFLESNKDELPKKIVTTGENLISKILSEDR
jgi:hypothetical protein